MNSINTLLYFLQSFGPNQLVRPETKTQHLAGETVNPSPQRACVHLSVLVCFIAIAWMCVHGVHSEETSRKSLFPSKHRGQCAHQLGMIMGVREALIVG